ncbi:MAG TPA: lasso peptide biosynthesis B2 protein [Vicinamibacterales bacterium]|nr:lasso peptide biosynthesis B2 protein [Vicinamibacterales bacterium]
MSDVVHLGNQTDSAIAGGVHPSDRIRFAFVEGIVVILDFATQNYFALNERGSTIWRSILDGADEPLDRDTRAFIDDCRQRGFLVDGTQSPSGTPSVRSASTSLLARAGLWTPLAIICLYRAASLLRVRGFAHVYAFHDAFGHRLPVTRRASQVDESLRAFYRAESVIPMPGAPEDCLPRSLALYAYLRSVGFPCTHLIGIRRYPSLTMHAWVEVDGRVVADSAASREFVVLARIGIGGAAAG